MYRRFIGERFGCRKVLPVAPNAGAYVWLHAVSLGETRAASVLIAALRQALPDMKLLLTHGTATGREEGIKLLREGDVQCWLPLDMPGATRRFLAHFNPCVGLLMETEIWPNLLAAAQRQHIPIVLVNARLSERSLRGALKGRVLLAPAYRMLAAALAQSDDDAKRLEQAGARHVKVMGNLKFDMRPDAALLACGRRLKRGCPRPIITVASSREGEEALLLQAWRSVSWRSFVADMKPVLLLVPRHPQRFGEIAQMISTSGMSFSRRSEWSATPQNQTDALPPKALLADVWLGDSVGEMPLYYGMSDVALLGGSFEPYGGQNLLEALACGIPVIMGPHTYNFAQGAKLAQQAGVGAEVKDFPQALELAKQWLTQPEILHTLQRRAVTVIEEHRGAAQRMAHAIVNVITARR